jgi:hypothetical protein
MQIGRGEEDEKRDKGTKGRFELRDAHRPPSVCESLLSFSSHPLPITPLLKFYCPCTPSLLSTCDYLQQARLKSNFFDMPTQLELLRQYSKTIKSKATTTPAPVLGPTAGALAGPAKAINQDVAAALAARFEKLRAPSKAAEDDAAPTTVAKGDVIATYRHYIVRSSLRTFQT